MKTLLKVLSFSSMLIGMWHFFRGFVLSWAAPKSHSEEFAYVYQETTLDEAISNLYFMTGILIFAGFVGLMIAYKWESIAETRQQTNPQNSISLHK